MAALVACGPPTPRTFAREAQGVLRIRITLTDAEGRPAPVAQHRLLISDNPATTSPREVVTSREGSAVITLPPGNYTIESDKPLVVGSKGAIRSEGPTTETQRVELTTAAGVARPRLKGTWFPDGFHGTMAELLCAISEKREPSHSARNNLTSLALCFAAVASAERGEPVKPGSVRQMPLAD